MHGVAKFLLGPLLVVALSACSAGVSVAPTGLPANVTASRIRLGITDNGRTLAVPVGGEIDVTLQTVGPGQYANPQVSSAAVRFLAVSDVNPPIPAGPTQLFRFVAQAPGNATISIFSSAGHNATFEVTLEVH